MPSPVRSQDAESEELSLFEGEALPRGWDASRQAVKAPAGPPLAIATQTWPPCPLPHARRRRCSAAAAQPPLLTVSHITLPTPPADDATDILEAANQVQLNDRRDAQQQKVDADFFNRFDDDADESDMRPPSA